MTSSASLEVVVHYCETGGVQHLNFRTPPSFSELSLQIQEYAEPGVLCTSLVLLQSDGSFLTSKSPPLDGTDGPVVLRMFSRQIIDPAFVSKAVDELHAVADELILNDLLESARQRMEVLVSAGQVLRVHATRELDRSSFRALGESAYLPYAELMKVDFPQIPDYLQRLKGTPTSHHREVNKTLLDAINLDQFHLLTNNTRERHLGIESKLQEATKEEDSLRSELAQGLVWPPPSATPVRLDPASHNDLGQLKLELSRLAAALFALLRQVASFDTRVLGLKKSLYFLQEHIALQRQFLLEVHKIKLFPDTYRSCVREAERRRQFATKFSNQVSLVSQYLARDRDQELASREAFYQSTFRLLPVAGLIPGLEATGVLPPVEINQRPIDPQLFSHAVRLGEQGEADWKEETENREAAVRVLSATEVLELQAENEMLKGLQGGDRFSAYQQHHRNEVEALEQRIKELEGFLALQQPAAVAAPTAAMSFMQFEEDPD
ncbi:hypothetical protein BASA81_007521 [Batrachochytrium salamandrivorans]|nr:hypothetical protein BASA81_007521 [Batrachochytrium salamandrivorans]